MKIRLTALAALGAIFLTTTANATVFYIDQFQITKNGNDNWFDDPFEDKKVPPSSEARFPNGAQASYLTKPDPMRGPEQNGKLALDTDHGAPDTSNVTGNPILIQRARLNTNTSNADADLNKGLKKNDTFTVKGVYDLIEPEIRAERYGIRLTDSKSDWDSNDNVQLGVVLTSQDDWLVRFREADYAAGAFNELDTKNLSEVANIDSFEQIALMLSKPEASSNEITASFELIDLDDESLNLSFDLNGNPNPTIFDCNVNCEVDGELWTRADFVAVQVVPIPAALPLLGSALGLIGLIAFKGTRLAT